MRLRLRAARPLLFSLFLGIRGRGVGGSGLRLLFFGRGWVLIYCGRGVMFRAVNFPVSHYLTVVLLFSGRFFRLGP